MIRAKIKRYLKKLIGRSGSLEVMSNSLVSDDSEIGQYTYIGYNCCITKSKIGRYCSIANNVSIGLGEHDHSNISTSSLFYENPYQKLTQKDCIIGNDVWIGVDSIVRRGVSIGNGAVIGANSFVNSDIPDFAIAAGNPAKIIKLRFNSTQIEKINLSKWWDYELPQAKKILQSLGKEIL